MHVSFIHLCFFYRLARDFLRVDYLFLTVGIVGGACTDVEQTFVKVTKYSKREQLLDIVKATGSFSLATTFVLLVSFQLRLNSLHFTLKLKY